MQSQSLFNSYKDLEEALFFTPYSYFQMACESIVVMCINAKNKQ